MKQITVLIDEDGNSSIDLTGFTNGSCARTMRDFQGDDQLVAEQKKPEYFRQAQEQPCEHREGRRLPPGDAHSRLSRMQLGQRPGPASGPLGAGLFSRLLELLESQQSLEEWRLSRFHARSRPAHSSRVPGRPN